MPPAPLPRRGKEGSYTMETQMCTMSRGCAVDVRPAAGSSRLCGCAYQFFDSRQAFGAVPVAWAENPRDFAALFIDKHRERQPRCFEPGRGLGAIVVIEGEMGDPLLCKKGRRLLQAAPVGAQG